MTASASATYASTHFSTDSALEAEMGATGMEDHAPEVAELLKLLANQNRLLILCALARQPQTVTQIAQRVPLISQSALSQNLTRMRAAGVLTSEKSGLNVYYSIADARVLSVMAAIEQNYCNPENLA